MYIYIYNVQILTMANVYAPCNEKNFKKNLMNNNID